MGERLNGIQEVGGSIPPGSTNFPAKMLSFNSLGRRGRLGNQMFQYAALFALAKRLGTDFCIPKSDAKNPWTDHQLLQVFRLPGLKFLGRPRGFLQLRETTFAYDPAFCRACPGDADLDGFFQSEKYFADCADDIRSEFRFQPETERLCHDMMSGVGSEAISLHVRRGDYVENSGNHPPCPVGYYEEALRHLPGGAPVLVFSDDPQWCRTQPLFQGSRWLIVDGNPNHVDMCLMSLCSHHVIANSSFSWWGAWLGRNRDKIVVAPDRWFGETGYTAGFDTRDLVPKGWIRS